jgi:hypothetical protein
MEPGTTFADMLDAATGAAPGDAAPVRERVFRPEPVLGYFGCAAGIPAVPPRVSPQRFKVFAQAGRCSASAGAHAGAVHAPAHSAYLRAERPVRVERPRRRLTAAQQNAFDRLIALGAPLDAAFTADELRSAFRLLARRYHPDRHPGADAGERSRLAALFADAHRAYTDLQPALACAGPAATAA